MWHTLLTPALLAGLLHPASAGDGPQRYTVDASHTSIGFSIRHLGLARVRGAFPELSGALLLDREDLSRSSITIVIRSASIDTGNERRDADLRQNFFEVERFPTIVFQSDGIVPRGEEFMVEGRLTIKDVTRAVSLPLRLLGEVDNPAGHRIGFAGSIEIDRRDFGVFKEDHPAERDLVIGHSVTIDLELEAVRQNPERIAFDGRERPSIGAILQQELDEAGVESAVARYARLRADSASAVNLAERELLVLGMKLLWSDRAADAAALLRAAADAYPESAPLADLLGQSLVADGAGEEAVAVYRSLLARLPDHAGGLEMMRRLAASD